MFQWYRLYGNVYIDGAFGNPYPVNIADDGDTDILGIYITPESEPPDLDNPSIHLSSVVNAPLAEFRNLIIERSSSRCRHFGLASDVTDITGMSVSTDARVNMYQQGYKLGDIFLGSLQGAIIVNPGSNQSIPYVIGNIDTDVSSGIDERIITSKDIFSHALGGLSLDDTHSGIALNTLGQRPSTATQPVIANPLLIMPQLRGSTLFEFLSSQDIAPVPIVDRSEVTVASTIQGPSSGTSSEGSSRNGSPSRNQSNEPPHTDPDIQGLLNRDRIDTLLNSALSSTKWESSKFEATNVISNQRRTDLNTKTNADDANDSSDDDKANEGSSIDTEMIRETIHSFVDEIRNDAERREVLNRVAPQLMAEIMRQWYSSSGRDLGSFSSLAMINSIDDAIPLAGPDIANPNFSFPYPVYTPASHIVPSSSHWFESQYSTTY